MNWTRVSNIRALVALSSRIENGDAPQMRSVQCALTQSVRSSMTATCTNFSHEPAQSGERAEREQKHAREA